MPISHEVVLKAHSKTVQTLALDYYGDKLISGGLDYGLKIWDLAGMNRKLRPMMEYHPYEGYPVNQITFNPTGQKFLCCCANNQAKVFFADG